MNALKALKALDNARQQIEYFEDFLGKHSVLMWVATLTDTGTAQVVDGVNGNMPLTPSDGTVVDNDEAYYATAVELFLFAADKPFIGGARIQFTETVAGEYNAFVGFANAFAADLLIDAGGGMRASGSLAMIYKVDGGTVWKCTSRNNGVVTDSTSTTGAGGTAKQHLEVEIIPFSSTQCKVHFRVDGIALKDAATGLDIVHTVTVASATEMQFGFGCKLGAATNNVVLNCDYAYFAAQRTL